MGHLFHVRTGYSVGMLKAGLYGLGALVLFALVFALMPARTPAAVQTGATLHDATLTFYPSSDEGSVWKFAAKTVTHDPEADRTELQQLSNGERWITGEDGAAKLDATLQADQISIDGADNMTTSEATVRLVQECADIHLQSEGDRGVQITQSSGFSAPKAKVESPFLNGQLTDLEMSFGFEILSSGEGSNFGWNLDPTHECVGGTLQPISKGAPT